jgi:hypothetical protein
VTRRVGNGGVVDDVVIGDGGDVVDDDGVGGIVVQT